ncbi:MAG TPA: TetR/AcrR family transcriptional regulator [Solirubrobacteraceae bacterium]|nr:TetR/AcrR family transcriptional regulator [Solirubrobacteraceae bacterium]
MTTRTPKPRMPASARRELIVDAAVAEFAQLGYEAASVGRIATAAGVTRTVLYDHFPSKHALFVHILELEQATLIRYLSAALGSPGTTEDRWRAAFDAFFAFVEEQPLGWRLLFPSHAPQDPDAGREYRRVRAESNRILASLLAADARRAGLEPETVRARAVFAMHRDALSAAARWWQGHPEVSRAEVVDSAMAALWTGFGGMQPH